MLTRRHLRIKVMQQLYASTMSQPFDLRVSEKELRNSNEGFYQLYILLLNVFGKIQSCGQSLQDHIKKQYLSATPNELSPKFFSNRAVAQLTSNTFLKNNTKKFKINHWKKHDEYVRLIWDHVASSDCYAKYLKDNEVGFESDKKFLIDLFTEVIAPYERLHELIEEIKSSWVDDFPLVNTIVRNTLLHMQEDTVAENLILSQVYKDTDDEKFAFALLKAVAANDEELSKKLIGRTPNWEQDRIAVLDMILLKLAIAEFLYFPTIPIKVTINEYLEIAKEYATPKSSLFINGVLDVISKDMESKQNPKK